MAIVARDHDWFVESIVGIDYCPKRFKADYRMVSEMYDRGRCVWPKSAEADLQRGQLTARMVRVLDDHDSLVARNRTAHAFAARSEDDDHPRHDGEHRLS